MFGQSIYRDRRHAGRVLAEKLARYRGQPNLLVLALPRGGVALGYEVAKALEAPLDVLLVRKLGLPGHEEFAIGAIASGAGGGVRVMNPMPGLNLTPEAVAAVVAKEQDELARREKFYRGPRPPISMAGRTVILVDDGLATGSTMRAAVLAVRQQHPARVVVAVPVGARESCRALIPEVDDLVCPAQPEPFHAVSLWYEHMPQSTDEEVCSLLERAWHEHALSVKAAQQALKTEQAQQTHADAATAPAHKQAPPDQPI